MRKRKLLIVALLLLSLFAANPLRGGAAASELKKIRCTCYCEPGLTRSGHYTHEGIIAGRKEDLGNAAALYAINEDGSIGEFIGYFDFYDTGAGMDSDGDGIGDTIRTGKSVDVYKNTLEEAKAWIKKYGDYVYIKIIEAEG